METLINMRDIARHTKVSIATVSKCLSGKRDVSPSTRERILAACKKLDYRPNPLVSALMRSRRQHTAPLKGVTLAFVSAFPTPDGWSRHPSPIFRQMFQGAMARATERNYQLEHFWLFQDGMSNLRFSRMLLARGIRGLLLAPVPDDRTPIDLTWLEFSVVVLGITPVTSQFNRVATDYYQSMLLAIQECANLGYRRPGLAVRTVTLHRLEYRWEAAFRVAAARHGLRPAKPLFAPEWTADNVARWLDTEKPDVLIGPVHGRLLELVRATGRRIPRDLGIVALMVPKPGDWLSGILQDGEWMGRVAMDQLISQLERNETGIPRHPVTHTTRGHWNRGRTLRVVKKNP